MSALIVFLKRIFQAGNRRWLAISLPPALFGAMLSARTLCTEYLHFDLPQPTGSAWTISILVGFLLATYFAWLEEYKKSEETTTDHDRRVVELEARLGRPHITLSWEPVRWKNSQDDPIQVPTDERSEIIVTCHDKMAFDVWLNPFPMGDFKIQGRLAIVKLDPGQSVKVEYTVTAGDGSVNLEYWGRLDSLLERVQGPPALDTKPIDIPILVTYRDIDKIPWKTDLQLFYLPGTYREPVFQLGYSPHL